jgi:hypothetical protein
VQRTAVGEFESACRQVDIRDVRRDHVDRGMLLEDGPVGPGDVLSGQLGTGHLVEQRLELVVVVVIHECHLDVPISQLEGTGHPGEPPAENQDPCSHLRRPPLARFDQQRVWPSGRVGNGLRPSRARRAGMAERAKLFG